MSELFGENGMKTGALVMGNAIIHLASHPDELQAVKKNMLLIEIKSKTSNLFENNFSNTDITGGWTCTDLCDIPTFN